MLSQRIHYGYDAPVRDLHQELRTVPPARHGGQRRRRWHLEVRGVDGASTEVATDAFGNHLVAATAPVVATGIEFCVEVEVDVGAAACPHPVAADPRYLTPTALTAADAAVAELAAGTGSDIAGLCSRVHRSLTYEWGITGVHTTAAEALAGGRGVCQDYAHIMLAACRHAGIPARYVSGHLTGEGGSHAWVEVLHPHTRRRSTWVAEGWDPTHDRRISADYLTVAVGRDYRDAAPMAGSYDGDGVENTLSVSKQLRRV